MFDVKVYDEQGAQIVEESYSDERTAQVDALSLSRIFQSRAEVWRRDGAFPLRVFLAGRQVSLDQLLLF